MDSFSLRIDLGNDAMQENEDVADALAGVATDVGAGQMEGIIRDVNGNTVGRWQFQ
jgi:hypothetical protein